MRIVGPRRPAAAPAATILSVLAAAALLVVASVVPASAAPTPSSGIDVRLPLGHQIRGFVRSPSGDPVAGAGHFVELQTVKVTKYRSNHDGAGRMTRSAWTGKREAARG